MSNVNNTIFFIIFLPVVYVIIHKSTINNTFIIIYLKKNYYALTIIFIKNSKKMLHYIYIYIYGSY